MQLDKISGGDGRKEEWWKTKYNKIFGLNSIHGYIYIYIMLEMIVQSPEGKNVNNNINNNNNYYYNNVQKKNLISIVHQ